jgi:hypothetical protein
MSNYVKFNKGLSNISPKAQDQIQPLKESLQIINPAKLDKPIDMRNTLIQNRVNNFHLTTSSGIKL